MRGTAFLFLASVALMLTVSCASVDEIAMLRGDTASVNPCLRWNGREFVAYSVGPMRRDDAAQLRVDLTTLHRDKKTAQELLAELKSPIGKQYWITPNNRVKLFGSPDNLTSTFFYQSSTDTFVVKRALPAVHLPICDLEFVLYEVVFSNGKTVYVQANYFPGTGDPRHGGYIVDEDPIVTEARRQEELRIIEARRKEWDEERRQADEKIQEEMRREEQRIIAEHRIEVERIAEEKRKEDERVAQERKRKIEQSLKAIGIIKGQNLWLRYPRDGLNGLERVGITDFEMDGYGHDSVLKLTMTTPQSLIIQMTLPCGEEERAGERVTDVFYTKDPSAKWGGQALKAIKEKKIFLGMTRDQVRASWGLPRTVNRSVGAWGVHEQWVYRGTYLYFENDRLTSYQD